MTADRAPVRMRRGAEAQVLGVDAEEIACRALSEDGWIILGRRVRTAAGEVDIVADRAGLLAIVEVKARPSLAEAASALGHRQRTRLLAAAEILLGDNPSWGRNGVRFDVLLVDGSGAVRRIADAFRREAPEC